MPSTNQPPTVFDMIIEANSRGKSDVRAKWFAEYPSKFTTVIHMNRRFLHTGSKSGISCCFYPEPNGTTGIKAYLSMEEAVNAFDMQNLAATAKIAPKILGGLTLIYFSKRDTKKSGLYDRGPVVRFGYRTERAKSICSKNKNWDIYNNQYEFVTGVLRQMGLGGDADRIDHRNFGTIKNRLVALDFGSESKIDFFDDEV